MDRHGYLLKLWQISTGMYRPQTSEESDAFVEALLATAATCYAANYKVGSGSLEELANAAYHAIQDKAEEIKTRN